MHFTEFWFLDFMITNIASIIITLEKYEKIELKLSS